MPRAHYIPKYIYSLPCIQCNDLILIFNSILMYFLFFLQMLEQAGLNSVVMRDTSASVSTVTTTVPTSTATITPSMTVSREVKPAMSINGMPLMTMPPLISTVARRSASRGKPPLPSSSWSEEHGSSHPGHTSGTCLSSYNSTQAGEGESRAGPPGC